MKVLIQTLLPADLLVCEDPEPNEIPIMMASSLTRDLCERLHKRHAALTRMGRLRTPSAPESAWWESEYDHAVDCWWLTGASPSRNGLGTASGERVRFRDGTEGLVLLNALARVDTAACIALAERLWPRTAACTCGIAAERVVDPTRRVILGFAYHIFTCDDLAPISERVFGVQAPSDRFLDDMGWLTLALSPTTQAVAHQRGIPVRIHVHVLSQRAAELARLLRQLVHAAIAQRLHSRTPAQERDTAAQAMTRFAIVEVCLEDRAGALLNIEALDCLARLAQLDVRVRALPSIVYAPLSEDDELSMVTSLQTLLPPQPTSDRASCLESVYATGEMAGAVVPALFSAVQQSRTVMRVELDVRFAPDTFALRDAELARAIALWKWAAYALFSRHAAHSVTDVTLHVHHLDRHVLHAVEAVLRAEHPLDVLYTTTSVQNDDVRVVASHFHLHDPNDMGNHDPDQEDDAPIFRSVAPQTVRVIDKADHAASAWWRVLLPGYGQAWVYAADTDAIEAEPLPMPRSPERLMALQLEGVFSHNASEVLGLLRLVGRNLRSVAVEMDEDLDDEFDLTEWTLELLHACPHVERLQLPWYTQTTRLMGVVDAAEAGYCRLRVLSLRYSFHADTSDLLAFLEVLTDAAHPFTRRLEELHIGVEIPTLAAPPQRDFSAAWQRLLRCNRTLHTLTLWVDAPATSRSVLQTDKDPIAIRTSPLSLTSKLAFLSTLQTQDDSARSRLDTGVLALVFAFAAPHRDRKITIEWDSTSLNP